MSLFKKPTRKFRQRVAQSDSDDDVNRDHDSLMEIDVPKSNSNGSAVAFSRPSSGVSDDTKDAVGKKKSLLSFSDDEEEDGEVFKVKKSNYSRRLIKQRQKERKKKLGGVDSPSADVMVTSDTYPVPVEEIKKEIKKEKEEEIITVPDNEPTIIVKPLTIPPSVVKLEWKGPSVLNGEEAEDLMDDNSDDDENKHVFHPFKTALQSGVIPDAATIYAVKKHRQKAREQGDFVSLEDGDKNEDGKSRLVRDDDNDRSDDDSESGRLNFTVNVAAVERQRAREAFLSAQDQEGEIEDEVENWEREQIRKGVSMSQSIPSSSQSAADKQGFSFGVAGDGIESVLPFMNRPSGGVVVVDEPKVPRRPIPASVVGIKKDRNNLTLETIRKRLEEQLASMNQVNRAHKLERDSYRNDLDSSLNAIEMLQKEAPRLAQSFSFYQETRGYVADLIECLDVKLPKIELLEQQMLDLLKKQSEAKIERRQQDVKDQSAEYSTLAQKAMRGIPLDFNEDRSKLDEAKLRRVAEREGRRMRRRKLREVQQSVQGGPHHEGLSSDDEIADTESLDFKSSRNVILEETRCIFEDVVSQFGSIEGVKKAFETWRERYPEDYKNAYVPLCLHKIFGGFIRLQLLGWNPLAKTGDLETLKWYKELVFYGSNTADNAETSLDPDVGLLPSIVEKVVLPKLTLIVEHVWDPLSTTQTLNLVNTTIKFCRDYPSLSGKSKRLQEYLRAVVSKLQKCLEDDIFIPLYPRQLLENSACGVSVFFHRQFWVCVKLLRNVFSWHGIIAEQPLRELALGCLLNRYVVLALQSFPLSRGLVEKCKAVVSTFPRAWFSQQGSGVPQLEMLQNFLVKLVGRCQAGSVGDTQWIGKEVLLMLTTMGAVDKVAALAKEFDLDTKSLKAT